MPVLALDFGGTKLAAGMVDVQNAVLLESAQIPTPADAHTSIDALLRVAAGFATIGRLDGVGVAFGGHVVDGQILRSLHVPGWETLPAQELPRRIQARFGAVPVRVANDSNAMTLAEWRFGAGRGLHSMLFTNISTGLGGGLILQGALQAGSGGMAGEIGHMKIFPAGRACPCGKRGCLEAYAAGPGIAQSAGERLPQSSSLWALRDQLSAKIIAEHAQAADTFAIEVLTEAAGYLGLVLANAVTLLDVQGVVISGGVAQSGAVWWSALRASFADHVMAQHHSAPLLPGELTAHGGIWGGAALF